MAFNWSLQKVLDVTATQEKAQKAELLRLAHQIAELEDTHARRRGMLKAMLDDVAHWDLQMRRMRQEVLMQCFYVEERTLRTIQKSIAMLHRERTRKVQQLAALRNKKDKLSDLRDQARREFQRELDHKEQQQLDEVFHIHFARSKQTATSAMTS